MANIIKPNLEETIQYSRRDILSKLGKGALVIGVGTPAVLELMGCGGGGGITNPPTPGAEISQRIVYRNSDRSEFYRETRSVVSGSNVVVRVADIPAGERSKVDPNYCALRTAGSNQLLQASASGQASFIATGDEVDFYGMNAQNGVTYAGGNRLDRFLNRDLPHGRDVIVRLLQPGELFTSDPTIQVVAGDETFISNPIQQLKPIFASVGMHIDYQRNNSAAQVAGGIGKNLPAGYAGAHNYHTGQFVVGWWHPVVDGIEVGIGEASETLLGFDNWGGQSTLVSVASNGIVTPAGADIYRGIILVSK